MRTKVIAEMSTQISDDEKIPNCGRSWGFIVRSDIEVYLDILELMPPAGGREGVQVLFRILNRHGEGSESSVIT